ncbi:MAG: hypothetical protein Q4D98_10480 [Planctomycetia bacterium]|nr:hypothetical protein [Planctomycetia bacterium]
MGISRTSCRVMVVLGGLVCLFSFYRVFLLPLLEPPMVRSAEVEIPSGEEVLSARFKDLFPEGSWERNPDNIIIENESMTLILQDYSADETGMVIRGKPCTALFYPEMKASMVRRPMIVRIPDGIELHLDAPITSHSFGKPVKGRLLGLITATYAGNPAPDDDLLVRTRNLIYQDGELRTSEAVEFRWGKHQGMGRDFVVKLDFQADTPKGPEFSGIRSFVMRHLEYLRMVLDRSMIKGNSVVTAGMFHADGTLPFELTCTGPLSYDVRNQKLLFSDQVRIGCRYLDGIEDAMTCDALMLSFAESTEAEKPQSATPSSHLTLQQVLATGQQVSLLSNRFGFQALGTTLSVNLPEQTLRLEDVKETTLAYRNQEFHGKSIEYQFATQPGEMGSVLVNSQGWMKYVEEKSSQVVRASWRNELRTFPDPDKKEYTIQLSGQATLDSPLFGKMSADTLSLWLAEKPKVANASPQAENPSDGMLGRYVPARMNAKGGVRLEVQRPGFQVFGTLDAMDFWFTQVPATNSPTAPKQAGNPQAWVPAQPTIPDGKKVVRSFKLKAKTLGGMLEMSPDSTRLAKVHLIGDVLLSEEINYRTSDMPILVTASQVQLADVAPETLQGRVLGEPAILKGHGMELSGSLINLNCAANRVWMGCPGEMRLFVRQKAERQIYNIPETVQVTWDGGVSFDGTELEISKNVRIRHPLFAMDTQHVAATTTEPIVFARPPRVDASEVRNLVESVDAAGDILVEYQSVQEGKTAGIVKAGTAQMSFSPLTGNFSIPGRGWIQTTSLTSPVSMKKSETTQKPPEKVLFHTNITFDQRAAGNVDRMELQFHGNVVVAGDEVTDWNQTISHTLDPIELKEHGFLLHADFMQVNADPNADKERMKNTLEFLARQNVRLEMRLFSARADQLSYSMEKDKVVLHGNPERVSVDYQKNIGSPHRNFTANHIEYSPSTQDLKWDGMIMKESL